MLGPKIILAGPGTGKTTSLVNEVFSLLNNVNSDVKGIIICTFTRKATEELKTRLYSKIPYEKVNKINLVIGTIHSMLPFIIKLL